MPSKEARRWLVEGRVQGVGFRYFVQNKAAALGLIGWVRNLDSGAVEVYAAGPPKRLDEFAASLHAGPQMSDVRSVQERRESVQELPGFSIR